LDGPGVCSAKGFLNIRLGREVRFDSLLLFFSPLLARDRWHAILSHQWNAETNDKQEQGGRKPTP
jgi:hypothetical protein